MFMKKYVKCSLLFVGLSLLSATSSMAFETAVGVGATAITSVPYTISTSGNYYLATNLSVSSPVGAAIIVNASEVILDLNGRTLSSTSGTGFGVGIYVANQLDVTIQNGDIDGFQYGIYLAPNSTDNNAKNTVDNVRFNNDGFGVLSVSGQSNWVKNCIIDGGDIGIFFYADLGGSRASNNILEAQKVTEQIGVGVALVSSGGMGTVFDNNVVSKGASTVGQIMSGADKYRFESFVGFPGNSPHVGGINEMADSL
jgi:hypothetical protein